MAVDTSSSIESPKPKLPEVAKAQKESSPSNRFATAKSRISNYSSGLMKFFRSISGEKPAGVNLEPEVQEMQALSKQLQALEINTKAQLQTHTDSNVLLGGNGRLEAEDKIMPDVLPTVETKDEVADITAPSVDKKADKASGTESEVKPLTPEDYAPFTEESIEHIFENPDRLTYTTLTFESGKPQGDELNPTKRMLYRIPKEYQGRVIRDVVLKHRKDPSRFSGNGWDSDGAYSRVLIKDTQTGEWRSWVDPAGYGSDKFAEPRSAHDPENEVLHDWITTVGKVNPSLISVENVGKTKLAVSNVHGLEVVFFPETEGVNYQEQIFSPGTEFVDLDKGMREPRYGGGPGFGGKYPGAVALGGWGYGGEGKPQIDNDPTKPVYLDEQGRMHIKLQPGKKFVNLELAIGDTHSDGIQNKDGHTGTLGWAKIYAGLKNPTQENVQYFMKHVNVPPAGVLAGGPEQADRVIQNGEEIVIDSRLDTSYLMGYRVAYQEDEITPIS